MIPNSLGELGWSQRISSEIHGQPSHPSCCTRFLVLASALGAQSFRMMMRQPSAPPDPTRRRFRSCTHRVDCALCPLVFGISASGVERAKYSRDGLVTTDKFCLSRFGRLELSWWRFPLRLRARPQVNCPSPQEVSAAGGSDAAVAGASGFAAPPGRAAALGQDLSATHGLDPNTTKRRRGPGRPRASSRGGSS